MTAHVKHYSARHILTAISLELVICFLCVRCGMAGFKNDLNGFKMVLKMIDLAAWDRQMHCSDRTP